MADPKVSKVTITCTMEFDTGEKSEQSFDLIPENYQFQQARVIDKVGDTLVPGPTTLTISGTMLHGPTFTDSR